MVSMALGPNPADPAALIPGQCLDPDIQWSSYNLVMFSDDASTIKTNKCYLGKQYTVIQKIFFALNLFD